ncbi:MAG: prepilin-type N-terminal cleavage/methylation domain-containing protein [bacterium]
MKGNNLPMNVTNKNKGFTILEVLVSIVIVIIVILAVSSAVRVYVRLRVMQEHKRIVKEAVQSIIEEMYYYATVNFDGFSCDKNSDLSKLKDLTKNYQTTMLTSLTNDPDFSNYQHGVKIEMKDLAGNVGSYLAQDQTPCTLAWACARDGSGNCNGNSTDCIELRCKIKIGRRPNETIGFSPAPIEYTANVWKVNRALTN